LKDFHDTGTQTSTIINGEELAAMCCQTDQFLTRNPEKSRNPCRVGRGVNTRSFTFVLDVNECHVGTSWRVWSCVNGSLRMSRHEKALAAAVDFKAPLDLSEEVLTIFDSHREFS
jgi:hypothetical protein